MQAFEIGKSYFFRAVTFHCIGQVVGRDRQFLILGDAAWVADSGRFTLALKTGVLAEVEPTGDMTLNMDAIVDAFPWPHELPGKAFSA